MLLVYCPLASTYSDLLYKIRKLYSKIINNGYYKEFNEIGMYGIFFENEDSYINQKDYNMLKEKILNELVQLVEYTEYSIESAA